VALMERILALDVQLIEVDSVMTSRRDGPLRVALEAIGGDGRRRRDVVEKEPSHISLLEADAVLQSRSSSALCSDEDQGFARAPPMGSAAATHICFIDLDVIAQPVSTLTSGASPQLVHPCPRGLEAVPGFRNFESSVATAHRPTFEVSKAWHSSAT
jgi:hypothetical protein